MILRLWMSFATVAALTLTSGCGGGAAIGEEAPQANSMQADATKTNQASTTKDHLPMDEMAHATFGGGCFWCTEAVFLELQGVQKVTSGYSGGSLENPTYRDICTGATGHAEVIHIEYNPKEVEFVELLEVFFKTHDPTTLNRQGADVGTQYRSVVFFHSDQQQRITKDVIASLNASGAFNNPIVTEVSKFTKLYPAEDYHQNYYAENGNDRYCQAVVRPKVEKLRKVFRDKLKKSNDAGE